MLCILLELKGNHDCERLVKIIRGNVFVLKSVPDKCAPCVMRQWRDGKYDHDSVAPFIH